MSAAGQRAPEPSDAEAVEVLRSLLGSVRLTEREQAAVRAALGWVPARTFRLLSGGES